MTSGKFATDVCLDADLKNAPHCPHGPTLVFERCAIGESSARRFYACSACRDRKDCQFFQWEDADISEATKEVREDYLRTHGLQYTHQEYYDRFEKLESLLPSERKLCKDCGLLLLPGEWSQHKKHEILDSLSAEQLRTPSRLLPPIENKKTNAQYLFSDDATQFIISTIKALGFTRVLCIGAPRIHEAILNAKKKGKNNSLESLLLDIDHRYMQFYSPQDFCRYNMFNNHFFEGEASRKTMTDFVQTDREKVLLLTDPPFGGLVEVLAHSMRQLMCLSEEGQEDKNDLSVLWFFPYFMEPRMSISLPEFKMLDYKVDYDNHALMQSGKKKKGSPVRIYTNIGPGKVKLPATEGYRFCAPCKRYVSTENSHCDMCEACTSKDGSSYRHCFECGRCVKPSRVHCTTCNQCDLPEHKCKQTKSPGCFICGDLNHKRRDCPAKQSALKGTKNTAVKIPGEINVKKPMKRPWQGKRHNTHHKKKKSKQ